MLICISIRADTGTLCFRPIILKRVNSSELVVETIVYLVKGRQTVNNRRFALFGRNIMLQVSVVC